MNTQVQGILEVFEGFRMDPLKNVDQYEEVGKGILAERLGSQLSSGSPIKFLMLGYPMKSPNTRDKVLGDLPDMAEEASFDQFRRFGDEISKVYAPGVEVAMASDGYMFNDVVGVSDRITAMYADHVRGLSEHTPIKWYDLNSFYSGDDLDSKRVRAMLQFGISEAELERRIMFDTDVNMLYRGMIRFMIGDLAFRDLGSNSQLQKEAKRTARIMMMRNEAYSALIRKEFEGHIRLSMHPSVNNGSKYSFKLIDGPGDRVWTSPWHCALVIDQQGRYETIHRKEAERRGLELVSRHGRPYHYTTA